MPNFLIQRDNGFYRLAYQHCFSDTGEITNYYIDKSGALCGSIAPFGMHSLDELMEVLVKLDTITLDEEHALRLSTGKLYVWLHKLKSLPLISLSIVKTTIPDIAAKFDSFITEYKEQSFDPLFSYALFSMYGEYHDHIIAAIKFMKPWDSIPCGDPLVPPGIKDYVAFLLGLIENAW
jgi:hypothetical protein